ncbi:hypothetical protein Pcaca05_10430 [Pectobacterium carotovorum subsp. carotovorum]|nr:hypothetical protein Pcaca05_10430 [Pectobacterium carotovorum subsp. carotovorum]
MARHVERAIRMKKQEVARGITHCRSYRPLIAEKKTESHRVPFIRITDLFKK